MVALTRELKALALAYYVYYRVAQPARARPLVEGIQAAVENRTGVTGRLRCKRDDPSTWMEIYEDVTDGASFEACLAEAVQACEFSGALSPGSRRHMECFEYPCA